MRKNNWQLVMVLGCICFLTVSAFSQPKVHQLKIREGHKTHNYLYTYDSKGQIIYERKQLEANGQLTNIEQTEWLSLGDSVRLQRKWIWQDGAWKAVHHIKSRFANSLITSEEYAHLDEGKETIYKKMIRINSTHDYNYYGRAGSELKLIQSVRTHQEGEHRKKVSHTYYSGNSGLTPVATSLITYVTDQLGRTDSILVEVTPPGESTEKYLIRTFYKGNDTLPSTLHIRKWNSLAMVWDNMSRTSYGYFPDGKLAEEVYEYFREMRWIATNRYTYAYYSEGVLQEKVTYESIYRQWRRLSTIEYRNISEGYPRYVSSTFNFWGGTTGSDAITDIPFYFNGSSVVKRASSVEIEYVHPSKVDTPLENDAIKVVMYPNPTNGLLFMSDSQILIKSWEIYDMQGRRLQQLSPDYPTNRIDISNYPAGMYLIRIVDSENRYRMQKITKY